MSGYLVSLPVCTVIFSIFFYLSLKKTLYSFRNIALAAGIIYCVTSFAAGIVTILQYGAAFGSWSGMLDISLLTRTFTRSVTFVLILLCGWMAISNVALLRHEGKRLKNLLGTFLGLAFVGASVILETLVELPGNPFGAGLVTANGMLQLGFIRVLFFGGLLPYLYCMLCYFECMMFAIALMGWIAAKQVPQYNKDFIIILGCSISKSGGLLPLLKQRVNRALRYAWEQESESGKPVLFVPSGGQGTDEVMSEGSAMALYLQSHSVEEYEVFPEKKSRNTYENFVFSRRIILDIKKDARVAFATTNYHVFRSGMLARKAGFDDIEAIASKTKWYFWPNGFAREVIGIFAITWKYHAVSAASMAMLCIVQVILAAYV